MILGLDLAAEAGVDKACAITPKLITNIHLLSKLVGAMMGSPGSTTPITYMKHISRQAVNTGSSFSLREQLPLQITVENWLTLCRS